MTRNWKEYNRKLVRRGEFYLTMDFIEHWNEELEKMNVNKRGSPFAFPQSFIAYTALMKTVFSVPYRQLEGILEKLSQYIEGLTSADYTTLWRRIRATEIEIALQENRDGPDVIVAIDSTGMKVTNRGEWMREKWKKKRGWIKVHIAVDAKTKEILAIEVTDERVTDNKEFEPLLNQCEKTLQGRSISLVLADGAHDTRDAFNYLKKRGIKSGIKIRKNASTRSKGSRSRAQYVRELKKIGYKAWKKKYHYGMRWASEGYFSAVKRIFGENMRATSTEGMIQEVKMKFLFYNVIAHTV